MLVPQHVGPWPRTAGPARGPAACRPPEGPAAGGGGCGGSAPYGAAVGRDAAPSDYLAALPNALDRYPRASAMAPSMIRAASRASSGR